jgi:hypothetical protein
MPKDQLIIIKFNYIDGKHFGVDINGASGICNTYGNFVWEPTLIK